MESELHRRLRELVGDEKAAELMALIDAESEARVRMYKEANEGWQRHAAELSTKTLQHLQSSLPWGSHDYSGMFNAYPAPHRDFAHAFLHVQKAMGKLAIALDAGDHLKPAGYFEPEQVDRFLADIVICTLRMANTCPGRKIDLQHEVEKRLYEKFPKNVQT